MSVLSFLLNNIYQIRLISGNTNFEVEEFYDRKQRQGNKTGHERAKKTSHHRAALAHIL